MGPGHWITLAVARKSLRFGLDSPDRDGGSDAKARPVLDPVLLHLHGRLDLLCPRRVLLGLGVARLLARALLRDGNVDRLPLALLGRLRLGLLVVLFLLGFSTGGFP